MILVAMIVAATKGTSYFGAFLGERMKDPQNCSPKALLDESRLFL